jgi:hypothetical protein
MGHHDMCSKDALVLRAVPGNLDAYRKVVELYDLESPPVREVSDALGC